MRYKFLVILIIIIISFSFLAEPTFAKHIDGHLTASEVATAFDTFGKNEDEMRKACEGAAPPAYVDDCIIAKKNMFCWWITGERNKVRGGDGRYNEGAYEECVHKTVTAKIQVVEAVTRGAQVGMTGVPGPGVAGGVGVQIGQTVIQGAKTAKDIIDQGKEMEEERKEKEKLDKTSAINSLNQKILNQKVPSIANILIKNNEIININVMESDPGKLSQLEQQQSTSIGIKIQDGTVYQISDEAFSDATINVYLSENKANSILKSSTNNDVLNIVTNSLKDGSIKFVGSGANRMKFALTRRVGTVLAKFTSSPFDVKTGKTATVNFAGREATLERNPLGQRIVSVGDSPVVYKISKGGEVLGYSTKGTQNLLNKCSPVKRAYGQCSKTAGYYLEPTISYMAPAWAGSGWHRPI